MLEKLYEIIYTEKEFMYKERHEITCGCTTGEEPTVVASFKTLEEAREELKKYETEVWVGSAYHGGSFATIKEYSIQENVYEDDEDGNTWLSGGDIWDTTELPSNPFDDSEDEDDE